MQVLGRLQEEAGGDGCRFPTEFDRECGSPGLDYASQVQGQEGQKWRRCTEWRKENRRENEGLPRFGSARQGDTLGGRLCGRIQKWLCPRCDRRYTCAAGGVGREGENRKNWT